MHFIAHLVRHDAQGAGLILKTLRIVRILSILLLAFTLHVGATGYSQKVSLQVREVPLEQVFTQLKKQTNYSFMWDEQLLKKAVPVTISVKNVSLTTALDACFKEQPLTYRIIGNMVVINPLTPKDERVLIMKRDEYIDPPPVTITGVVLDSTGETIIGASIFLVNTKVGTTTDNRGRFSLTVNQLPAVLLVTSQGYRPKEIRVNSTALVTVVMQREEVVISEITIATGIFNRKKETYTGAATVVSGKELQQFGTRNLITSLRNIDPSFNILESNTFGSNPNRLPEIQVRGNSNIPNVNELQDDSRQGLNTPLVILDGFESTLRKLLDINENEVESIALLKDAAATAIYGSRGANGVVVITTRAPRPGKLRITYRGDVNVETPDLTDYNLLGSRDKLELERLAGYYNNARAENDLPLKRYYNYILNEINSGVETDWMSLPLRNAWGQRHNLRIEGGHQAFRYSASAQLNDVQGVMKESFRKTFNGNITLSYIFKSIRFTNNLQITENNSENSPYGTFSDYVQMNPYWRPYNEKGAVNKIVGHPGSFDYTNYWQTLPTNPLYNATLNTFDKTKLSELINNTNIEWNATRELLVRARFGIVKGTQQSDVFRPADHTAFANYAGDDLFRKGDYNYGINNAFRYDGALNLSYNKLLNGKHSLFAGVEYNIRQSKTTQYNILAEGFTNPNFDFLPMALQYAEGGKPSGSESLVRSVGYVANASIGFFNRYIFDGSYRLDGSSQYGSRKRFAPFWSLGAAWNVHDEPFFEKNEYINRLKLRASLGVTGSQNFSAYQALSTYRYYTDARYYGWSGAYLIGLGNENLRWQQNEKINVGLETDLFKSRIRIIADYYIETTKDLVSSVFLPGANGFSSYIENIGSLRNNGFEIKATVFVINQPKKGLSWSITGAVVQNKNKVLTTSQALKDAQRSIKNNTTNATANIYTEGYSSNTIWVVRSLGIDPSTGKELYLDLNNQATYTWSGNNVVAVGNTDPDYFGNFSTLIRYKALALNVSFGYRFGGQQYNQTLIDRVESGNYRYNVDRRVFEDRWKQAGDNSAFKGLLVTSPTYKTSRFVQDENTLTCQNINLQYNVRNRSFLQKWHLEALSFAANAADVFYISTIRRERGISYPFSRQFTLNFTATF